MAALEAVLALAGHARTRRPGYVAVIGQLLLAIAATTSNIVGDDPLFFVVVAPLANAMWLFGAIAIADVRLVPRLPPAERPLAAA